MGDNQLAVYCSYCGNETDDYLIMKEQETEDDCTEAEIMCRPCMDQEVKSLNGLFGGCYHGCE